MTLKLITAPAAEPITLANTKIMLGIASADTASDTQITAKIIAARKWLENRTGRALITQTWSMYEDEFEEVILLPFGNIQSVSYIKYTDTNGDVKTLDSAEYQTDLVSQPARIMPSYSALTWPSVLCSTFNAVEIQFVAGYGLAAAIPEDLIEAMYRIVGHWLNQQAALEAGANITRVPFAVEQMISPYCITTFGPEE